MFKVASKQEVDIPQIQLRYTIQFSILMLCVKYQEAGLCGSREKCDREIFCDADANDNARRRCKTTTQDDGYWSLYVAKAGRRHNEQLHGFICTWSHNLMKVLPFRQHWSFLLHLHVLFFCIPYWSSGIYQEYIIAFQDKLNYREITGQERM